MDEEKRKALALAAAHQAQIAATELIRYVSEGPNWPTPFGHEEVVEKLADALKMAVEVEVAEAGDDLGHPEEAEMRNQLHGACSRFLEGWAG